jgi:hypothetical protein
MTLTKFLVFSKNRGPLLSETYLLSFILLSRNPSLGSFRSRYTLVEDLISK